MSPVTHCSDSFHLFTWASDANNQNWLSRLTHLFPFDEMTYYSDRNFLEKRKLVMGINGEAVWGTVCRQLNVEKEESLEVLRYQPLHLNFIFTVRYESLDFIVRFCMRLGTWPRVWPRVTTCVLDSIELTFLIGPLTFSNEKHVFMCI